MSAAIIGINLGIAVAGLVICVLGLIQAIVNRQLDPATHRFLITLFAVLVVYVSFDLIGQILDDFASGPAVTASRACLFGESFMSALATLVLLAFLLFSCGEVNWQHSVTFRIGAVLFAIYAVMLVCTQFTSLFYSIDDSNVYRRGPLYPALLVPPALIMTLGLVVLWRKRNSLTSRQRKAFAVCFIVPAISMVCQMFAYGLYVVVLGTSIAAFVLFAYIQADQAQHHYQAELENARLKSDIMLSQLQPHFLCNTLGAIGRLCRNDPEAKEAINAFSRYLRENVNSLSQDAPAPFERELEHAKTYLKLEQLRFGDDLHVEFDIECTEFLMPTLTLQPLAENAVRHGIRETENGTGTVTISSREHDDRWEVAVIDDGAGFDPSALSPKDEKTHIGLANVRERLHYSCNGELHIDSAPGQGSRVTIAIPKS